MLYHFVNLIILRCMYRGVVISTYSRPLIAAIGCFTDSYTVFEFMKSVAG